MNEEYENYENNDPIDSQVVPTKEEANKRTSGKRILALALCCSLLGGIVGSGITLAVRNAAKAPATNTTTIWEGTRDELIPQQVPAGQIKTAAQIYTQNVGSTVGITTAITTNFWGFQTTSAASGSGFVLSDNGYILTNYHVVEGSSAITVTTYDGTGYEATLVGYDESNDIAILKVEAEGLTPVILGDSDMLNIGDDVVAIGNPLGELTFSLTAGKISAKDRRITLSSGTMMNLIQTDCAINSGNSGGALFNMYGEVIGVTNAKYSGNGSSNSASIDNIGFAIPINHIRDEIESIIEKGYVIKPYIGVSVSDVGPEAQAYGLPQGAAVRQIVPESPAEKAGLQINDIITKVGDRDITGSDDLVETVRNAQIGDTLTLEVFRQGQSQTLTLEIGEQTQTAVQDSTPAEQQHIPQGYSFGY